MRASLPWASRQASPQRRGGHTDIEAFGNESESLSYERVGMRAHCTGGWKSRCDEVFYVAGFRPGWRGPFVSAKGPKTRLAVVSLRVPCAVRRLRRRANSLRSNNARLFSGVGCTARSHHKAKRDCRNYVPLNYSGPTRGACPEFLKGSNKVRRFMRASDPWTERQASVNGETTHRQRRIWKLIRITMDESLSL